MGNEIRIDGLKELRAKLKELERSDVVRKEFNASMVGIVREIRDAVRDQMPEVSGAAKRSVGVRTGANALAIHAGGPNAPYYPWLDFGGTLPADGKRLNEQHLPFFHEGRWIYPSVVRRRPEIYRRATEAVELAKGRVGL